MYSSHAFDLGGVLPVIAKADELPADPEAVAAYLPVPIFATVLAVVPSY